MPDIAPDGPLDQNKVTLHHHHTHPFLPLLTTVS